MGEPGTDADRYSGERHAEVQEAWQGMRLRQLRSLSEEELVRRHDILMDRDIGIGTLDPEDYRAELDRRVTMGYVKRLDSLTTWLVRLTVGLVALTVVIAILTAWLIGLELGIVGARH